MTTPASWSVRLDCPHCGAGQDVPRDAISGTCTACYRHLRIEELLNPKPRVERAVAVRNVQCLECRTAIAVAPEAVSCWCPKCSKHLDLSDRTIAGTVCREVSTLGTLTLEKSGCLVNCRAVVGAARLAGRFEGSLWVEGALEIAGTARVKGTLRHVGTLKILAGAAFAWPEPVTVSSADIGGDVSGSLTAAGVVRLRPGGRFRGDLRAGGLVVDEGAVLVGNVRTGR
jgi:cytoskeletal protein CcmA (bactofilin family)